MCFNAIKSIDAESSSLQDLVLIQHQSALTNHTFLLVNRCKIHWEITSNKRFTARAAHISATTWDVQSPTHRRQTDLAPPPFLWTESYRPVKTSLFLVLHTLSVKTYCERFVERFALNSHLIWTVSCKSPFCSWLWFSCSRVHLVRSSTPGWNPAPTNVLCLLPWERRPNQSPVLNKNVQSFTVHATYSG